MNPEGYLEKNILKLSKKLEKKRKQNRRLEMELIFSKFINGKNKCNFCWLKNSNDVSSLMKEEIRFINQKIDAIQKFSKNVDRLDNELWNQNDQYLHKHYDCLLNICFY